MRMTSLHKGLLASMIFASLGASEAFAQMQMLPPQGIDGSECSTAGEYRVLVWKNGDAIRCLKNVTVDQSGNLVLTKDASLAGGLKVDGDTNIVGTLTVGGAQMNATSVSAANSLATLCSGGTLTLVNGTVTCVGASAAATAPTTRESSAQQTPDTSSCASTQVTWSVNGATCSGTAQATRSGYNTTTYDQDNPSIGRGQVQMLCVNGVFQQGVKECSTTPVSCTTPSISWSGGDTSSADPARSWSCSGAVGTMLNGESKTIADYSGRGSLMLTCSSGSLIKGTSTCAQAAATTTPTTRTTTPTVSPSPCVGPYIHWGDLAHERACSGYVGNLAPGSEARVVSVHGEAKGYAVVGCSAEGKWYLTQNRACNP